MAQAISANKVFKKFDQPEGSMWKKFFKSNTNGQKPVGIAVDNVSFEFQEEVIFGVLGLNGSEESTLIWLIAKLLPEHGDIRIIGHDAVQQSVEVLRLLNRVSVEASFFMKLSPMEKLLYGARLYGMNGKETHSRVQEILLRLGLKKRSIYKPVEEMSWGVQQNLTGALRLYEKAGVHSVNERQYFTYEIGMRPGM